MGDLVPPDSAHALFCKSGFSPGVRAWAKQRAAVLRTPADLLAPFA
jgi:hypothetical protein